MRPGMHRELQWASGKLAGVNLLGVAATARAAYLGKLKSARELSTPALQDSDRGDPARGIQALQPASQYELGPAHFFLPIYVRGLVYLHARKGQQAAAEFQRILNYRALGEIVPAYALSYVGLARAYALTGDSAKSRKAYQDFFALWKDADPDVPILKEAKAEYAKLQ